MFGKGVSFHKQAKELGRQCFVRLKQGKNVLASAVVSNALLKGEHNSLGADIIWDVRRAGCVAASWFFPFNRPVTNAISRACVFASGRSFGVRAVRSRRLGLFFM